MSAKPHPHDPRPKPIHVEGDVAYVTLTKGKVAVIDAADARLVGQWGWHAAAPFGKFYAQRSTESGGKRCLVMMHRLIVGAESGEDVDHIDGDTLNNRRSNLRRCTRRENMGNMRLLHRTSSA